MKASTAWLGLGFAAAAVVMASFPARAEHFNITLALTTRQGTANASWDTEPPEGGVRGDREVATAAVGEDLDLEWMCESEFPHGAMKNTVVRIFVEPEGQIGQKPLPPASTPHLLDNSFTADYLPNHRARGHFHFRVLNPGAYLVRLQSEQTEKGHGHEHFAALDLKVE